MRTALVTGANGFIGRALCRQLERQDFKVHAAIRQMTPDRQVPNAHLFPVGDLSATTDWYSALLGVDCVFHLAATVHQPENQDDRLYDTTILDATRRLVEQAISAGVKRFIYISTTKVYGKETSTKCISEMDPCYPDDPYGRAKLAAEKMLAELAKGSQLEWVIIRPPLVYGPEAKGNFQRLVSLVNRMPVLPLGRASLPRSIISVENLVDFIITCARESAANKQTFNISDGRDLSTQEICQLIAKSLGKKCWLMPIPAWWLRLTLRLIGKEALFNKLFGGLCYDIDHAKQVLCWKPAVSVESAIRNGVKS